MKKSNISTAALAIAISFTFSNLALADEGMWTFDNFPSQKVQKDYGFNPSKEWLNHIQNSAVRLSSGCSASFVSSSGLILTNWHCTAGCAANLTTAEHDYSKNGFYAKSREEEVKCPGMQAEVLQEIIDITKDINGATIGKAARQVAQDRALAFAKAEEENCKGLDTNKFHCDIVSLYHGGQYKVYKYRIYDDVRLVFEPEYAVGFFGGDPDNFNFPRYNLDSSFLRAYENGKPISGVSHLKWSNEAPKENDLVFVAGNPGSTKRLLTTDQLAFQRDWVLPVRQLVRAELRGRLTNHINLNDDNRRESGETLFSIENSYKAQYGQMRALMDPQFFAIKQAEENDMKQRLKANKALNKEIGNPWAEIKAATDKQRDLFLAYDFLEGRAGSISELYGLAKIIVRITDEKAKPLEKRLPGFSDIAISNIERQLSEPTPIYKNQEIIGLETWLSKAREYLTVDDARVKNMLGNQSPENLAKSLINNTKLIDPNYRLELLKGGKAAVDASNDPLIQFIRKTDANARAISKKYLEEVDGPISQAAERIAKARFALYGSQTYPDATFTLRLSYGKVQGWEYNGVKVPAFTKMGGAFERATGAFPFELAPSWVAAKDKINKDIIFDLSTTNDIIGGNSGSPLIDKDGRVIGAVFDGNIHSLGGDFAYDGRINRAVSVSTVAIQEALSKIYGMDYLVKELHE